MPRAKASAGQPPSRIRGKRTMTSSVSSVFCSVFRNRKPRPGISARIGTPETSSLLRLLRRPPSTIGVPSGTRSVVVRVLVFRIGSVTRLSGVFTKPATSMIDGRTTAVITPSSPICGVTETATPASSKRTLNCVRLVFVLSMISRSMTGTCSTTLITAGTLFSVETRGLERTRTCPCDDSASMNTENCPAFRKPTLKASAPVEFPWATTAPPLSVP